MILAKGYWHRESESFPRVSGVILTSPIGIVAALGFPRVSGGDPTGVLTEYDIPVFSPRERG